MTNYNKAGLFIVFSKKANKFVIGYKPKYFNDVSFAPLVLPITNEKILDMENLSLKIKLTNIFDCENKSSFSIDELRVLDKFIQTSEFLKYINYVSENKKSDNNNDCKLAKISSIINTANKERQFN